MSMSQSKLMLQLSKQQKVSEKVPFSDQKIQDLYSTISKLQPKNLMLVQFLTLIIQKNLIKNSPKVQMLVQMYQQIRGKKLQQQHSSFVILNKSPNATSYSNNSNNFGNANSGNTNSNNNQLVEKQEQKFNKKKFLKLLNDVAKLLYPGDPKAYEVTLYLKLIMPEQEQNRLKVDDNLKKFLNEEVVSTLGQYDKQLQTLFEVYMPQNYNFKLGFQWNQIRLLQKKLPIMCLLRILFETQVCPQTISQIQFLQILTKMIPPLNSNHKEVMFYYSQTFNNYMRQHIFSDGIKLLQGDIGLTFFEFQMVMVRIATQISKQSKLQFAKCIDKLMVHINITEVIKTKKQLPRMSKTQSVVYTYLREAQKSTANSLLAGKSYLKNKSLVKKQNQQLYSLLDQQECNSVQQYRKQQQDPLKKLEHQSMLITKDDLYKIKINLDNELGTIPEKNYVDKENQGHFNVNQKFTVIGEQLPKLQQKNKPAPKPNPKQKKQDSLLGFKPQQQHKDQALGRQSLLLNRKKKLRLNNEHPVILSQVFYPTSFSDKSSVLLSQEQQVFIQTTYIHLGERMYEQAYTNFQKGRRLMREKKGSISHSDKKQNLMAEFFFQILQAQIFEATGRDQAALVHYYTAREIGFNLQSAELMAKAFVYVGISSSFYHLQQFQFALRCLFKAKQVYGDKLEVESIENAILLNNIGSCYMMLNRNQQAVKYFNLSHQILDLKTGRFDERTLVVQQNISKNKKAYIQQMPTFKTMWKTYVQKSNNIIAIKTVKKTKK